MFPESNDSVGHEREPKSNARICSALKEVYHAIEPAPFTHAVKKVQPSRDMYTTVPTYRRQPSSTTEKKRRIPRKTNNPENDKRRKSQHNLVG